MGSKESEEEALFRSYPYAVYFVQSPSTISHANEGAALSRYSSSRGSNNSFFQLNKKLNSADENAEKSVEIVNMKSHDQQHCEEDEEEEEEYVNYKGWKYFSFGYSDSGWWFLLQLSWRFLVSFLIALLVFYVAAKPPAPNFSIKVAGIRDFRLGEGVDSSGVTTKLLSCNCSINLFIDNKSKLFALHIHPPILHIFFDHLPFAMSQRQGRELSAGNDDITMYRLNVGTRNKAMYGAGRNMQDLLESGKGLPLVIRVSLRSSFHVVWGIIQPKFHHEAQCLVVLTDKYDKKRRTQVYNSTCVVNS
ncbi:hypothetical protein ACS0TY_019938 [Phlomoides rotata]